MTSLELLEFGGCGQAGQRRGSRQRPGRRWMAICLLVILTGGLLTVPFLHQAQAVLIKDLFSSPLSAQARKMLQIGISYGQGEGFSLQVTEDRPVRVWVDGAVVITRASFPDLKKILRDAGVQLGPRDRAEARMVSGEDQLPVIKVVRVRSRVESEKVQVAPQVKVVPDYYLSPGETLLMQQGQPGVMIKKTEIITENGQEVARRVLGTRLLQEPRPEIIARGVSTTPEERRSVSRSAAGRVRQVLRVTATAYTHTGYCTATGVMPYVGGVAVDPRVIPLGSKLYIEGYGPARAVDTGGLIKGRRIDLFFDTLGECSRWGRREVNAYIME